jgi:predicted nuclease with TOPRIM domain
MSKAESMTTVDQLRQQVDELMKNGQTDKTDTVSKLDEEVAKNKQLCEAIQLKDAEINRLRKRKPLSVETKALMDTLQQLKTSGKVINDAVPLGDLMKTIERMDHEIVELREKCKIFCGCQSKVHKIDTFLRFQTTTDRRHLCKDCIKSRTTAS